MTSSVLWEVITEESDFSAVTQDYLHPRTSGRSLRVLAQTCAKQGSVHVTRRLPELYAWLAEHRDELPFEVEDEHGNRNSDQRLERLVDDYDMLSAQAEDMNPQNGLYDVGQSWLDCYKPLSEIADRSVAVRELFKRYGLITPMYCFLMRARGELFEEYFELERLSRMKDNNPQGYGRMQAELHKAAGRERTPVYRNVKELPANVEELVELRDGELYWKVAQGTKAAGSKAPSDRWKWNGKRYSTKATIEYLTNGHVAEYAYRNSFKISIVERLNTKGEVEWDVRVFLKEASHTLAVCKTRELAEEVRIGALWEFNHRLTGTGPS